MKCSNANLLLTQTSYLFGFPEVSQWNQEVSYQMYCIQPCSCFKRTRNQAVVVSQEDGIRSLLKLSWLRFLVQSITMLVVFQLLTNIYKDKKKKKKIKLTTTLKSNSPPNLRIMKELATTIRQMERTKNNQCSLQLTSYLIFAFMIWRSRACIKQKNV